MTTQSSTERTYDTDLLEFDRISRRWRRQLDLCSLISLAYNAAIDGGDDRLADALINLRPEAKRWADMLEARMGDIAAGRREPVA